MFLVVYYETVAVTWHVAFLCKAVCYSQNGMLISWFMDNPRLTVNCGRGWAVAFVLNGKLCSVFLYLPLKVRLVCIFIVLYRGILTSLILHDSQYGSYISHNCLFCCNSLSVNSLRLNWNRHTINCYYTVLSALYLYFAATTVTV